MKILVVEDNEKNMKLFSILITSLGHEVTTAMNGEQGIARAREEKPDLVLMDIQMPVMDGVTALGLLKADRATRAIPVIALTSYAMKGDREKFLQQGFDGYIAKPVNKEEFIAVLTCIARTVSRHPRRSL